MESPETHSAHSAHSTHSAQSTQWKFFGKRLPKSEIVFFSQVIILYTVNSRGHDSYKIGSSTFYIYLGYILMRWETCSTKELH